MKLLFFISLAFLFFNSFSPAQERNANSSVSLEDAFPSLPNFARPVYFTHANDSSGRVFVVEQSGRIWSFQNSNSISTRTLFLDIRARVDDSGNEMGLLSIAFHPNFKQNNFFYVNYTAANPMRTVISRFSINLADTTVADSTSEYILLEINQPYTNHNGGLNLFGPDGNLYIGMGDGGSGGDPQNNAQNRTVLLGKMLRINVDSAASPLRYSIPSDNPFVGNPNGWREEIWAYGLRNPWRFSFDNETGWMYCADVGQSAREEIDIVENGGNYGWRCYEGNLPYNTAGCSAESSYIFPIKDYVRSLGSSVTGGYVYRGTNVPQLVGRYIYADYVSGRIWKLLYNGVSVSEDSLLIDSPYFISSFGEDENGELYICAFDGRIYKFRSEVINPPSAPFLVSPRDSAQLTSDSVFFFWNRGTPSVQQYHLQVSTDAQFSSIFFSDSSIADTSNLVRNFLDGEHYWWRVAAKNIGGWGMFSTARTLTLTLSDISEAIELPPEFSLRQNYPNPFNPTTKLSFVIRQSSSVTLYVYDVLGKEVAELIHNKLMEKGNYEIEFNASRLTSGVYFARLNVGSPEGKKEFTQYRTMLLVK
ncbi:MAG: PQQ-dependent sugar dehydrogenase [Ignavibacteriales bacterium]|nr:PQQ-dependent sugar dehydrogenase [Ignavibacteriales bacterium]